MLSHDVMCSLGEYWHSVEGFHVPCSGEMDSVCLDSAVGL